MNKSKKIIAATVFLANSYAVIALSPQDNLGVWGKSSFSEQAGLCQEMVRRIEEKGKLTASSLCSCISETAADGGLDFMLVNQVGAACALQLK